MSGPKSRILYIVSLVILGILLVFTVSRPIAASVEYSQVQRTQLLEEENQWIIELHILNNEGQDTDYTINVLADGASSTDTVTIQPQKVFKYIAHIYKKNLDTGRVSLTVYREGEATPFEQATYYLK